MMAISRLLRFRSSWIKLSKRSDLLRFYATDQHLTPALFYPQAFPSARPRESSAAAAHETLHDEETYVPTPIPTLEKWMRAIAESKTVLSERSGITDVICKEYQLGNFGPLPGDATKLSVRELARQIVLPRSVLIGPLLFVIDTNAATDYQVWEDDHTHVARTLFVTYRAKVNSLYQKIPNVVSFGAIGLRLSAIWSPVMPTGEVTTLINRGADNLPNGKVLFEEVQRLMNAAHNSAPPLPIYDEWNNIQQIFSIGCDDCGVQSRLSLAYDTPAKQSVVPLTMESYHLLVQQLFPRLNGGMAVKFHLRVDPPSPLKSFSPEETAVMRATFADALKLHSGM